MKSLIQKYVKAPSKLSCRRGATMVEYALVVAVIAVIAVAGFKTLGTGIGDKATTTATTVANP